MISDQIALHSVQLPLLTGIHTSPQLKIYELLVADSKPSKKQNKQQIV